MTQEEVEANLSPASLTILLTQAITKVRAAEVPADVLAQAIMVAIQTEVNRGKMELVRSLGASFRATS